MPSPAIDAMTIRPRVDFLNIGFFDWDGERLHTGGAERYIADLAQLLAAMGYRPRFIQNARQPFTRNFRGIEVVGVAAADGFDLGAMAAGFAACVNDAALVIASPVELASRVPAGIPVIGINHGIWWDLPAHRTDIKRAAHHAALMEGLRRVDACVCVDTNFINWLRTVDSAATRNLEFVPNYVDTAMFSPVPKDFGTPRLSVLYPRRLCEERGFHEAIAAFDDLMGRDDRFDLHLCGGGAPAEEALARAFVARHAGRARWSEAAMAEMPAIYGTSQIVIIPTLFSEGTSLACLEAMATRNAVIATHVGGLPNLVLDGVNGLLIKPGAAALADALVTLADDRALLADLAESALEVVPAFSIAAWRARWKGIVERVAPLPAGTSPASPSLEAAPKVPGLRRARNATPAGADTPSATSATDVDALLNDVRAAQSERDGAYRAVLVAAFDRDDARRAAAAAADQAAAALRDRDAALQHRDAAYQDKAAALAQLESERSAIRDARAVAAAQLAAMSAARADALHERGLARQDHASAAAQHAAEQAAHARTQRRLARTEHELAAIKSSRGWRMLRGVYGVIGTLAFWRPKSPALPAATDDDIAEPAQVTVVVGRDDHRATTGMLPRADAGVQEAPRVSGEAQSIADPGGSAERSTGDDASHVLGHAPVGEIAPPPPPHTMRARHCGLVPGLVSVVLPVYNQAGLLATSIESVLAQTYRPLELIVVDDGSTDAVEEVLRHYAARPEVKVLVQSNQRLPKALAHGFAHAKGEFWTWTSSDNLMGARHVERLVEKLRAEPDLGMTYADYYVIDEHGNALADRSWRAHNRPDPASGAVRLPRRVERLNVLADNFIGACFLYRGWIGRVLRDYDPALGVEDYDYWMRINALFRLRHLGTDELLYWYRVHSNTLSAKPEQYRIPEKILALMATERARAEYFASRPVFAADPDAAAWLAARGITEGVVDGRHPLDVHATSGALVVDARHAGAMASMAGAGRELPLVLVFADGAASPYDASSLLRQPNVLAVVTSERDAARVRALSAAAVVDGDAVDLASAIDAFARDAGFWIRTHALTQDGDVAAVPFVDAKRRLRMALQAEHPLQERLGTTLVELAVALRQAGVTPVILLRGSDGGSASMTDHAAKHGIVTEARDATFGAEDYRAWLVEAGIDLVNAHHSTFGAGVAAAAGIPFVQSLHEGIDTVTADALARYRDADAATTAYACASVDVARHADLTMQLDPARFHVPGADWEACSNSERQALLAGWLRSLARAPR
jgi:glycosyltransferase involved in cell wall biosynthesis